MDRNKYRRNETPKKRSRGDTGGSESASERPCAFPAEAQRQAGGAARRMELLIDSGDVGRAPANRREEPTQSKRGLSFPTAGAALEQIIGRAVDLALPSVSRSPPDVFLHRLA